MPEIVRIADVLSFELTPEEMQAIDGLDRDQRIGPHPEHFSANWA